MGSLSYAKQERTGINVSLFKDADSNGLYKDMYFIKNAAIQTKTVNSVTIWTDCYESENFRGPRFP